MNWNPASQRQRVEEPLLELPGPRVSKVQLLLFATWFHVVFLLKVLVCRFLSLFVCLSVSGSFWFFSIEGKDLGVFVFNLSHFRVKRCYQCRSLHLSVLICHEPIHEQQTQSVSTWVFPKIGVPQNGWFIMENPIKMDDLGLPLFSETSTYCWRLVALTLYSFCLNGITLKKKRTLQWWWLDLQTSQEQFI